MKVVMINSNYSIMKIAASKLINKTTKVRMKKL